MQIGIVGLGRMGGNMARRLARGGVEVIGFDADAKAAATLAGEGVLEAAPSVVALAHRLSAPRVVWIMLPAGRVTELAVEEVWPELAKGDVIVDGGNANYKDSQRRGAALASAGIGFVDCGVSGGVWGLDNGYALMFGGSEASATLIEPLAKILAPAADAGWLHCGPCGAGHFTKMIHNGIEYGMMQAYAEGIALIKGKTEFGIDVAAVAEMWRHGSVVRSWLLDLIVEFLERDAESRRHRAGRRRLGRGSLDRAGGDRAGRARAGDVARVDDALREPGQVRLRRQAARDDAQGLRRTRGRSAGCETVIVVLMGVSGCGKTAVGQALAADLGWPFFDGDDFHPEANVAKMAAGTPLVDADRWPWLDRLAAEMAAINARGADAVFACSALKQAYRDRFARAGDVRFVHLKGDYDTIAARLAARSHRYMPPTLLASQFATLEEPREAIVVAVRDTIPAQIATIRAALKPDRANA